MKTLLVGASLVVFALGGCGNEKEPPPEEDQNSNMEESQSNNGDENKDTEKKSSQDAKDSENEKKSDESSNESDSSSKKGESSNSGEMNSHKGPSMDKEKAKKVLEQYDKAYQYVVNVTEDKKEDNNFKTKQEAIDYLKQYMVEDFARPFVEDRFMKKDGEFTILGQGGPTNFAGDKPYSIEEVDEKTYKVMQERDNQMMGHVNVTFTLKYDGSKWIVNDVNRERIE